MNPSSFSIRREFFLFIVIPFIVWLICLWGFFSGKMSLVQDAISYYEHIGFFTDNLMRGVYPLWHPDWVEGAVPYNFFLRRIGDVNPLYWGIVLLKLIGVKQLYAYLVFLAIYFFLGVTAFWLTARMIFRDKMLAASAYLLLLFSSWGGQLFFTYIVILFTPILWFFYFLIAFAKERKKHQFLGICFCTGILVTTYIPFFFLTILIVFLITFPVFYGQETLKFFKDTWGYFKTNRNSFVAGVIFLIIACLPAINFYQESKQGEFALPGRHSGTTETSTLTVSRQLAVHGDLVTQGYFENIFDSHATITIEGFFISFFFFIMLFISVINPITRRAAFLLTTAVFLAAISITESAPIYKFVYDHVFFFKFMRNIYYVFWLAILPLSILFIVEQLRIFIKEQAGKGNTRILALVIAVHVAFGTWLIFRESIAWTTWLTLSFSLIFFILTIKGWGNDKLRSLLLSLALIVQPAHILYIMTANGSPRPQEESSFNNDYFKKFDLQRSSLSKIEQEDLDKNPSLQEIQKGMYYTNRWYSDIYTYVPSHQLQNFMKNRLYLADNTTIYDDRSPEFCRKMGELWESRKNVAFLSPDNVAPADIKYSSTAPASLEPVTAKTSSVKVVSFDANTLNIKTDLDHPRFLIWTDSYDSKWHVYINGKEGKVLRAFHAFKGVWIPEGKNKIVFHYATPLRYLSSYAIMTIFIVMLSMIVLYARREGSLTHEDQPS